MADLEHLRPAVRLRRADAAPRRGADPAAPCSRRPHLQSLPRGLGPVPAQRLARPVGCGGPAARRSHPGRRRRGPDHRRAGRPLRRSGVGHLGLRRRPRAARAAASARRTRPGAAGRLAGDPVGRRRALAAAGLPPRPRRDRQSLGRRPGRADPVGRARMWSLDQPRRRRTSRVAGGPHVAGPGHRDRGKRGRADRPPAGRRDRHLDHPGPPVANGGRLGAPRHRSPHRRAGRG